MPTISDRQFVAEKAPSGWRLGKWKQRSTDGNGVWEERKLDEPGVAYEFDVVEQPTETPGSKTVRLRMREANTEVLLLDRTAQIFVDGHYFGEYRGHWEVDGVAEAPLPGGASRPNLMSSQGYPPQYPPVMGGGLPHSRTAPPG